jgi:hypothetical protein
MMLRLRKGDGLQRQRQVKAVFSGRCKKERIDSAGMGRVLTESLQAGGAVGQSGARQAASAHLSDP